MKGLALRRPNVMAGLGDGGREACARERAYSIAASRRPARTGSPLK
jgi:hypothetical protein